MPCTPSLPGAAGLDMLSNHFGDELLPIMLPIVQQRLHDADWRARESGEGHRSWLLLQFVCGAQRASAVARWRLMHGRVGRELLLQPMGAKQAAGILLFLLANINPTHPIQRSHPGVGSGQPGLCHGAGALPARNGRHAAAGAERPPAHGPLHQVCA